MSLIEEAAKRLEQLNKAGVETPEVGLGNVHRANEGPNPVLNEEQASLSSNLKSQSRRIDLDMDRLAATGFVTPANVRSRIADEFRVLKRPLIANAAGRGAAQIKNANLIMVTSSIQDEGKSYCAINLAMSIAMELDRSVLLIDADVAKPSLPDLLNLPPTKGLLDVILDKSLDLGKVMLRTNVEKLAVISAGNKHDRATELLASDSMAALLNEISNRYSDRIVIFDSPPINLTTEARVLAANMGQIVFVVQAETTPQTEVLRALAAIDNCQVKLLVLNKAKTVTQGAYGYGYGYSS